MLDKNTSLVWEYLKNHFATSDKEINLPEIQISGLSPEDVIKSIDSLENIGYININYKYKSQPIKSINL
ncbi:hypothetical protein [Clostridium botulinum]|uniref:hypothetical protein n=1 Tax=Clostridium botulinum TaxID=1491 RepID=UPI000A16D27D|nr:hypothetical protein [Clostridium botulinum]AUN11568.1 hypothetical protein RSJ6_14090 [Clostridium botulinum]OSA71585.1 hypothetical protein B2H87_05895 [Clostridium botulinum]